MEISECIDIKPSVGVRLPTIHSASKPTADTKILRPIATCRPKLKTDESLYRSSRSNSSQADVQAQSRHKVATWNSSDIGAIQGEHRRMWNEEDAKSEANSFCNNKSLSSDNHPASIFATSTNGNSKSAWSQRKLSRRLTGRSLPSMEQQGRTDSGKLTQRRYIVGRTLGQGDLQAHSILPNASLQLRQRRISHDEDRAPYQPHIPNRRWSAQSQPIEPRARHQPSSFRILSHLAKATGKHADGDHRVWKQKRPPLELFIRSIRMVKTICGVSLSAKHYAFDCANITAYLEVSKVNKAPANMELPSDSAELGIKKPFTFNKHIYATENCLHFPLWAQIICYKLPAHRTQQDKERLCTFLRGIKLFSTLPSTKQMLVAETVGYNVYDRMRVIVLQNRKAEYFYMILSGSATVDIATVDKNTGVHITTTVNRLGKDDAFGETALIFNELRKATVTSSAQIEVLMVDEETFQKTFQQSLQQTMDEKLQFLRQIPHFGAIPNVRLRILSFDAKIKYYNPQKIIDDNLKGSMFIYYVMSGSVDSIYYASEDKLNKQGTVLYNSQGLYSELLKKNIGFLAGNRIDGPNSCNMSNIFPELANNNNGAKILLLSRGATLMRIPKQRVLDIMGEVLRKRRGAKDQYLPEINVLTSSEFIKQAEFAREWLEYRNLLSMTCATRSVKTDNKLPKLK